MLVLCNGMVRSGSTLQYNIARLIVESLGVGEGCRNASERAATGPLAGTRPQDIVSTALLDDPARYVFHTHDLDTLLPDLERAQRLGEDGQLRVLYVHRDLRDVVASMKRAWGIDFDECAEILDRVQDNYEFIRRHADADWLLVQRYDQVVADVPSAVDEVVVAMDLQMSDEARAAVVTACSLENAEAITRNLRRQMVADRDRLFGQRAPMREQLAGLAAVFQDRTTLLHHNHISSTRGASGVWKAALSDDEARLVVERYGPWMAELGYE